MSLIVCLVFFLFYLTHLTLSWTKEKATCRFYPNLKSKASVSELFIFQVTFLGNVVSEDGVHTDPKMIQVSHG